LICIVMAVTLDRANVRGPMEALSRRLTYRRPATTASTPDSMDGAHHTLATGR
jgi:uncharacterized membrane protein YeiB